MFDTFPLLQKEGKLFYAISHSSPKLRLAAWGEGGKTNEASGINILLQVNPVGDTCQQKRDTEKICQMPEI